MGKRLAKEVSIAIADAVAQCRVDVIAAYPITPQTHIVEHLSELVANGELDVVIGTHALLGATFKILGL